MKRGQSNISSSIWKVSFLGKNKIQRSLHVIKKLFYCNVSSIYESATVNYSISTFSDDILLRKPIRRMLQIPQSKPMTPTQMWKLREANQRRCSDSCILRVLPPSIARASLISRIRTTSSFALVVRYFTWGSRITLLYKGTDGLVFFCFLIGTPMQLDIWHACIYLLLHECGYTYCIQRSETTTDHYNITNDIANIHMTWEF